MPNHLSINLITKGLLNISNITKGIIFVGYQIVSRKGGSSPPTVYKRIDDERDFYEDIKRHREEIDVIKVKIDWVKKTKKHESINVKLLESKIEAKILKETGKNIKVELID